MKGHVALTGRPRTERRALLEQERRARKSGIWPKWEIIEMPNGIAGGGGWCKQIRSAARNSVFAVLIRPAPGGVTHLAITSLTCDRPTWWEAMRIKNELCGEHTTAVEVYPPSQNVVDEADMYHLWALPEPLNFGIGPEENQRSASEATP